MKETSLDHDWLDFYITSPDTRHKMRLVSLLFSFENNAGPMDLQTEGPTDRRTGGRTDGRTDTTSYTEMRRHI